MIGRLAVPCALLAGLVASTFGCRSRAFNTSKPNIVGGQETQARAWFASLSGKDDAEPFCGASVVGEGVLLTAAHCVHGTRNDIYVTVGHGTLEEFRSAPRVRVASVRVHPQWDATSLAFDAALLFLAPADTKALGPKVEAIPMAGPSEDPGAFGKVHALGFGGILSYGWTGTTRLREIELPVIPNGTCQSAYPELLASHLCAGKLGGGGDTCQGDSGGPLVVGSGSSTAPRKDVLVGLTSYGNGCAQRLNPGVYTRVSALRDWVQGEIQRERALRASVAGSVLHELATSYCYPGLLQEAVVAFGAEDAVTARRRFFVPSPDTRFARVASKAAGSLFGRCDALGMAVEARSTTGAGQVGALVLEAVLPSGEAFHSPSAEAFEAWGRCTTTPAKGTPTTTAAADPAILAFDIDPFWNSTSVEFGPDGYYGTSEDLSKSAWVEKGRCEKDGLLLTFETSGVADRWGRLSFRDASTGDVGNAFLLEKSSDGEGVGVKATAARLGTEGAVLDLALQVEEQIFGVELACNQPFDILLDGKAHAPRKVGDTFVHTFTDPAKRASSLPGRGRARSYRLKWTDWKPAPGEAVTCTFNASDAFTVTFD